MDQEFVDRMKERLQEMKADILRQLVAEDEEFRSMAGSSDTKDLVDVATTDIDKKLLSALGALRLMPRAPQGPGPQERPALNAAPRS